MAGTSRATPTASPRNAMSRLRKSKLAGPALFSNPLAPYEIIRTDAFDWLQSRRANSIHAVVTDPPYGLVEYKPQQLEKRKNGRGGVWRIPPTFDGCRRQPHP